MSAARERADMLVAKHMLALRGEAEREGVEQAIVMRRLLSLIGFTWASAGLDLETGMIVAEHDIRDGFSMARMRGIHCGGGRA